MSEQSHPLTYHSLHRHVQSIPLQYEHQNILGIYSSNQEPPMPSILQKSARTKKSQQKSLKKGISRVSKSKLFLKQRNQDEQNRHSENIKHQSKGTLLNFNIQQVVQNKYHITKPKDQIIEASPKKKEQDEYPHTTSLYQSGSNEKSFISQYRIVTYVPGLLQNDRNSKQMSTKQQNIKNNELQLNNEVQNCNKQNRLNNSNIIKYNHYKNESQPIQVVNENKDNNIQLNTWRISGGVYDEYYSNNLVSELNRNEQDKRKDNENKQVLQQQLDEKYPLLLNKELNDIGSVINQNVQLKDKIKHLQHEIIQIQRQKCIMLKNIQQIKQIKQTKQIKQSKQLKQQKQLKQLKQIKQQNQRLNELNYQQQQTINQLNQNIKQLKQQFNINNNNNNNNMKSNMINSQSHLYQQKYKYKQKQVKFNLNYSNNQSQNNIQSQIQSLQLTNAKISKQLSEKHLHITELNRKNINLQNQLTQLHKSINQYHQKIENQQEKLYRKDQKINFLSLEIDRLNLNIKQTSSKPQNIKYHSLPSQQIQTNQNIKGQLDKLKQKYDQLSRDYNHLQKKNTFMKDELQHLKYLQINSSSSALNHRSNNNYNSNNQVLKDKQLEQQIYQLQNRLQITERNLKQMDEEYSNLKQNFRALQELYIKQQDQLYQTDQQLTKITQDNNKLTIELKNLQQISKAKTLTRQGNQSIRLLDKQEQLIRMKRQFNGLQRKYNEMINEVQIVTRQRDELSNKYLDQIDKGTQLSKQYKQDMDLYMSEIQKQQKDKTSIIVNNYQNLILKLNQQIQIKKDQVVIIKQNYLKQITSIQREYKLQIQRLICLNRKCQQEHLSEVQKIIKQKKQCLACQQNIQKIKYLQKQNILLNSFKYQNNKHENKYQSSTKYENKYEKNKYDNKHQSNKYDLKQLNKSHRYVTNSSSKLDIYMNYQQMSRKQLQIMATNIHQDYNILQSKYKTLLIQKQKLQDNLRQNNRHLNHFQQQILIIKQQKNNLLKQKLNLHQQIEKHNTLMIQLKKFNTSYQDQKLSLNNKIEQQNRKYQQLNKKHQQLNKKYCQSTKQNASLLTEIKQLNRTVYENKLRLQEHEYDIRGLRIQILQQKQITDKKIKQIQILKQAIQSHKSKQQYYKLLFEKTQRQLQNELKQKTLLLINQQQYRVKQEYRIRQNINKQKVNKQQKSLNTSPIKQIKQKTPIKLQRSPILVNRSPHIQNQQKKDRQTQLYRIQIFKQLNKLLNLTSQSFTLQQIIQQNQQQYLRKLFNAIKQDHLKLIELKQFIIHIEQNFKNQKIRIKQDYDILYDKYLKYKTMSQNMEKDIEKLKLKLKQYKHQEFIHINL